MRILITDNDMDGVTPIILFKLAFYGGKSEVHSIDRTKAIDIINSLNVDVDTEVYIVDISYSEDLFYGAVRELIRKCKAVYWFDHHKIKDTLPIFKYYAGTFVPIFDTSRCGTKIFFDYLLSIGLSRRLGSYDTLVSVVDDWDRHMLKDPRSAKLNRLFKLIGKDKFVQKFLECYTVTFSNKEEYILEIEENRLRRYFENLTFYLEGNESAFVFGDVIFATEISEYFREQFPAKDVLAVVDLNKGAISMRSRRASVLDIARKFGGGGHINAAGFNIPEEMSKNIMSSLSNIL